MNDKDINEFLEDCDAFSDFDDDIADPDFIIPNQENNLSDNQDDDMEGILCLDSDNECENQLYLDTENDQVVTEIVIEATDSSDSESVPTRKGKKRKKNNATWKRNISKNNRAEGNSYLSLNNKKQVPKRITGPPCKCIDKCFTKLSDEEKLLVLETFNLIKNKEKQDTYLCGLISIKPVQRRRPKETRINIINRQFSSSYKIRISSKEIPVCKTAFCALFGVGKSVIDRLIKNLKSNIPSPIDCRGKHQNRPNRITEDVLFKINTHINSFPKCESHYSRNDNMNVKYLSPNLNISKLYKLYLKEYEPEHFESMQKGEKIKPIVKQDFFYDYFRNNFNLSFGTPKTDTCQTCDKLKVLISDETDVEKKQEFEVEKDIHLRKSELFYNDLKMYAKEAQSNTNIEVLSFDYQQNMPLPHIPCGDVFYKRQLWVFNFCIYSAKTGRSYHYMYDESSGKKGQNEVMSFLYHFLKNYLSPDVKKIYTFSDNCSSQNKNIGLVQFFYAIVQSKCFGLESIHHRYPEPGHSFLPCDRCFGRIEKNKRKVERIFIPETYKDIIRETSHKFHVIDVSQDMIFNFSDYTKTLYKKTITSIDKQKFCIMSYRSIEYKQDGLFCSVAANSTAKEEFHPEKKGATLKLIEERLTKLHSGVIQIKEAKFNDVQDLATKYVPAYNMWFYNNLVKETNENSPNDD